MYCRWWLNDIGLDKDCSLFSKFIIVFLVLTHIKGIERKALVSLLCQLDNRNHRVHRVAMAIFWRTFHRDGKIGPAWWGWGCTCTPSPFHSIYHHEQSCRVHSSWEGRYTPPISPLPLHMYSVGKTSSIPRLGCTFFNRRCKKIGFPSTHYKRRHWKGWYVV